MYENCIDMDAAHNSPVILRSDMAMSRHVTNRVIGEVSKLLLKSYSF